jgi:hypothetical protein
MIIKSIRVVSYLLLFLFPVIIFGQTNYTTRTTLYTLQKNEVLSYDEALMHVGINNSNYFMIIDDTLQNTKSFIHNGKIILELKNEDRFWIRSSSLDLSNKNGYILEYSINNQDFLNLNGTILGPYELAKPLFCNKTKENGVFYKLGNKYYFKIKDQKFGPFSGNHNSIFIHDSNRIFGLEGDENYTAVVSGANYLEVTDGKRLLLNSKYLNDNDNITTSIHSLYFNSLNNFGYLGSNSSTGILWINGIITQNTDQFYFGDKLICDNQKGYYLFSNRSQSIYKNGSRLYTEVSNLISENNQGIFIYQGKNNFYYLNDKVILDYPEAYVFSALIHGNNEYAIGYFINNEYFVKTSNKTFGPFNGIGEIQFYDNGKLKFTFNKDNLFYTNDNGNISPYFFSSLYPPSFYFLNENESIKYKGHTFESSFDYDYVVIDGESYGTSPALQSWIDPSANCFKWTALENDEYVLYSYPIK